jgi:hypothetical protein
MKENRIRTKKGETRQENARLKVNHVDGSGYTMEHRRR